MEEHARLLIKGLELDKISENNRDKSFQKFAYLIDFFHKTKVKVCMQDGLINHRFSFGTIYDLFYSPWSTISQEDSLKGISQATYQMVISMYMQHPSLGKEMNDEEWAKKEMLKVHYGILKIDREKNYVTEQKEWQKFRASYYASHPGCYEWKDNDDDFLPNRLYSDKLLEVEILNSVHKEEYENAQKDKRKNVLSIFFHDYVMKAQGPNIAAYTKKIGELICTANYYKYEHDLSVRESNHNRHSMRAIYSTLNRNGEKQYISLDFKHGMFEYHDKKGKHLGEFRFTGLKNSEGETSHDLTTLY